MRYAWLAAFLLLPLSAIAQQPLSSLKDQKRVLIVFAANGQDDRLRTQLARLDGQAMAERDLVLIPVLAIWGRSDDDLRAAHQPYTSDAEQTAIRHRFHIAPADFAVILVGKDGGEKLRSHTPITLDKLVQTIDAMPMRQQEMKTRSTH
jgi:hypothetical protein